MSMIYCEDCDKYIDTDIDSEHFEIDNEGNYICVESLEPEETICSVCNGSGEGNNEHIRCIACKGTGVSWA